MQDTRNAGPLRASNPWYRSLSVDFEERRSLIYFASRLFAEAIKDEPDFFLLALFRRITVRLTPILILGGHTHIRDCRMLIMKTVGWMSAVLLEPKGHDRRHNGEDHSGHDDKVGGYASITFSRLLIPRIISFLRSWETHCQCLSRLLHINNARASSPSLLYVTAPFSAANAVLPALNNAGANERHRELDAKLWARGCVEAQAILRSDMLQPMQDLYNLTLLHPVLSCGHTVIHLVFVDFIENQLLEILNSVQTAKTHTTADALATGILDLDAQVAWY
ncbi:hypothetical protein GGX14DRAFT_665008 [Mycena pura]|uniref:Uncharacterized protein n=1 Tax=Mycena pura TaxID=153505 RepID=A0AAD6UZX6_9AGAR|nr:hypothetical protein GGX14DRAFT_665008 [Mycena pura]